MSKGYVSPLFSVVIPTRNRIAELVEAIDSVVAQTFPNWEVIVVDDGSENQSVVKSRVEAYSDGRIKLIALPDNRNAAFARNVGIDAAKGKWIAFLDSDDTFVSTKLETVREYIEGETGGACVVFFSRFRQRVGKSAREMPARGIVAGEHVGDFLFVNGGAIGTPGIVVAREIARKVMFDPDCIKHQDYDFLLRLSEFGCRFRFIDEVLWIREYRSAGSNVGAQNIPEYTCRWLKERRGLLSGKARRSFLCSHVLEVMVQQERGQILLDLAKVVRARSLTAEMFPMIFTPLLPYRWFSKCMDYYRGAST